MPMVFHKKAFVATGAFTLAALVSLWWQTGSWAVALPLIIFYAVLILNTYFSIQCFSHVISPDDRLQQEVDFILVLLYFLLAWNLFHPLRFAFVAVALFIVATLKYVFLLGKTKYEAFLQRKIRIDAFGALSCVVAVIGMTNGFAWELAWIWTGAFALANVYVLVIRPMYTLPEETVNR